MHHTLPFLLLISSFIFDTFHQGEGTNSNAPFSVIGPWPHHCQHLCEDAAIVAYLDHRVRHDKLDMVGPESPDKTIWPI